MNTKHPHAELMLQYAQDAMETDKPWERWEYRLNDTFYWRVLDGHPQWARGLQYRRKPSTIVINGHEVPEPVRSPLNIGDAYWTPAVSWEGECVEWAWNQDGIDSGFLSRGLIHLTKEAAEAHAKALLSFTAKE